jgi:hypothetical protein
MICPTAFICKCTELITVRGRRWRKGKQLLDDSKETRGHWNLKDKTFSGTLWRTPFGRNYRSFLRQITKWIHTFRRTAELFALVPRLNCEDFHRNSSKSSPRASSMETNLYLCLYLYLYYVYIYIYIYVYIYIYFYIYVYIYIYICLYLYLYLCSYLYLYFSRKKRCYFTENLCNSDSSEQRRGGALGGIFVNQCLLTWPLTSGFLLLVNFNLSKATTPWAIQSWPVAGESGWMYKLRPSGGSPEPATIHWELETKLHSYVIYVVQSNLLSLTEQLELII